MKGPAQWSVGWTKAVADVGLWKMVELLVGSGVFYHLYNQVWNRTYIICSFYIATSSRGQLTTSRSTINNMFTALGNKHLIRQLYNNTSSVSLTYLAF